MTTVTLTQVLDHLKAHGPLGSLELFLAFSTCTRRNFSSKLIRLHREPKRIYIHSWTRTPGPGSKMPYLRPLYAVGNAPDAVKPPAFTNAEREARRRVAKGVKPRRKHEAKPKPERPLHNARSLTPQAVTARVPNSVWAVSRVNSVT